MSRLDDILDDFGYEVVNNNQIGRNLLRKKPKLHIKALLIDLIGDNYKEEMDSEGNTSLPDNKRWANYEKEELRRKISEL